MTHQEINEAIAEHLGWKSPSSPEAKAAHVNWQTADKWWIDPDGHEQFAHNIPDYCNDLNAMHEAEKVIRNSWDSYFESLISVRWRDAQPDRHPADLSPAGATAEQRAEAFLRTLNLWK